MEIRDLVMRLIDVLAVGRERTDEEKLRRRLHGDKGATFSSGKQMCLLVGGKRMHNHLRDKRQFSV